jgi:hypothetical protein
MKIDAKKIMVVGDTHNCMGELNTLINKKSPFNINSQTPLKKILLKKLRVSL